jgi:hypothetical protein
MTPAASRYGQIQTLPPPRLTCRAIRSLDVDYRVRTRPSTSLEGGKTSILFTLPKFSGSTKTRIVQNTIAWPFGMKAA